MSSVWDEPDLDEEVTPVPDFAENPAGSIPPERLEALAIQTFERVAREILPEVAERLVRDLVPQIAERLVAEEIQKIELESEQ